MSHHGEDSSHESGHAHPPPGIPEVKDEAGDTPPWVPKLGVLLGVVVAALIALSIVLEQRAESDDAPAADEETEAATD